jgi:hypothetical protein
MPTKRRPIARFAHSDGLSAPLVDLLLTGISPSDPFLEFGYTLEQLRALFLEREALLRKEWARRSGVGEPWAARFTGT